MDESGGSYLALVWHDHKPSHPGPTRNGQIDSAQFTTSISARVLKATSGALRGMPG
jgi:hypothetical protein